MTSDKTLTIALIASFILHAVIFLPIAYFKTPAKVKSLPPLKIAYLQREPIVPTQIKRKKETVLATAPKSLEKTEALPPVDKKIKEPELKEHQLEQIEIPPELPKEKEALYLSYYQTVREKIRKYVMRNYPRFIACGEVYMHFVLLSDGRIKEIRVNENRSCQSWLLKAIAKKSIHQAAPFAVFPKELNQPELSFNVPISFEVER
ncbi:MAG: hypothetical protein HQ595_03925 [Candidatus Omnitrophica bacterium]|nr:hypothetical protein [Candidatus Omnitrophota bacterium]